MNFHLNPKIDTLTWKDIKKNCCHMHPFHLAKMEHVLKVKSGKNEITDSFEIDVAQLHRMKSGIEAILKVVRTIESGLMDKQMQVVEDEEETS